MRSLLALAATLWLLAVPLAAEETAQPQEPTNGTVTIPLDRFLKMTRPGGGSGGAAAAAPVPHLFSSGRYRLQPQDGWVQVQARVSLQVFGSGWVEVPVLPQEVVVEKALLDGRQLALYGREGQTYFAVRRPGAHSLELVYDLPLQSAGPTRSFQLRTPATSVSTVELTVPGRDVDVTTTPEIPLESRSKGSATVVEGAVPGGSEPPTFSWTPLAAHPTLHGKVKREPARIYARLFVLATVAERQVRMPVQLELSILRNQIRTLELAVGSADEVVSVEGGMLAQWTRQGDRLKLEFSEPVSGQQSLTLVLEKPIEEGTWTLPQLQVLGAEQVKGSVGVRTTGAVEVSPADGGGAQGVRPIDVRELPEPVRQMTPSPLLLAYEYHEQPWKITLKSRLGKEIPVLGAIVEKAQALTLITPDGKWVSSVTYHLRNNRKQSLEVTLPEKAKVLSSFVNGQPVKPVTGKEGTIRIPLVLSSSAAQGSAYPVELSYWQGRPSGPVGCDQLEGPKIDVPISQMEWSVFLPRERRLLEPFLGGSMRPGPLALGTTPAGATAPAPASELANKRESGRLQEGAVDYDLSQLEVSKDKASEVDDRLANMITSASQGAFPVRLEIPREGRLLVFSQLMITGEAPTLSLPFCSEMAVWLAWLGLVALLVLVGARWTRKPEGWRLLAGGVLVLLLASGLVRPVASALLLALVLLTGLWIARNRAWMADWMKLRRAGGAGAAVLLLLLCLGSPPAAAESGSGGSVSLPLADFLRLTHKEGPQAGGGGPPVPFILARGDYRVTTSGTWARVQGDLTVELLAPGWQEIPLLPGDVVLRSASVGGSPSAVYAKDGRYCLMVRGPGTRQVQVSYHLPASDRSLGLRLPPSEVSTFRLILNQPDLRLSTSPELPFRLRREEGRTIVEGAAPNAEDQVLQFSWERAAPTAGPRPKPRMAARVYSLVQIGETAARCLHRVDFEILKGEADHFQLEVPADVVVAELTCPELAGWNSVERNGAQIVTAALGRPLQGTQTVQLTLDKPIPGPNQVWEVPPLRVSGVERVKGSLGLAATGGVEVSQSDVQDARPVDTTELPSEVVSLASSPLLLAYEYHKQPCRVAVETRKDEELAVLTASVDDGQGRTLVTPDGKVISTVTYSVRNNQKQYLELGLPAGAQIWSTFVGGEPVKPLQGDGNLVRIPLSLSQGQDIPAFPVEVTYAGSSSLHLAGQVQLTTPWVKDLPISRLAWELYLPQDLVVLHTAGTLRRAPIESAVSRSRAVPSSPAVSGEAGHEAKLEGEEEAQNQPSKKPAAPSRQVLMQQMIQASPQGTLPVRVEVPAAGQPVHFSQLMVTEERPTATLFYVTRQGQQWLGWLALAAVLLLGAPLTRREKGWLPLLGLWLVLGAFASFLGSELLGLLKLGSGLLLAVWALGHLGRLAAWASGLLPRRGGAPPQPASTSSVAESSAEGVPSSVGETPRGEDPLRAWPKGSDVPEPARDED